MRSIISSKVLALMVSAALTYQLAPAQIPQQLTRGQLDRKDALVQESALQTLLYLRSSAIGIDKPRDRVRVLAEVGDALWPVDREQAREAFKQSFAQAVEFDKSVLITETHPNPSTELQQAVVSRIARRDPVLALSLSRGVAELSTRVRDGFGELYGTDGGPSEMLVKAAQEALSSNPNQASEMAKLASADGLSQRMRLFLLSLRSKDKAAADALFTSTLHHAAARRPKHLVEALFHWDYAFQRKIIYLGAVAWFRESPVEYPVPAALKQGALKFAVDAVVENTQQSHLSSVPDSQRSLLLERYALIHSLASQILADVEALMPSASPVLLAALNRLDHELKGQGRTPPEPPEPLPQPQAAQGNIEKLLERARTAPTIAAQDGFYAKAALRLYLAGEYERALEVARSIDDSSLRLKVMEPIRFDWVGDLIERNNLEAATDLIQPVVNVELRIALLTRLANAYFTTKNPAAGLALLQEAQVAVGKAKPSSYLASAILAIGKAYLKLNDRDQAEVAATLAIELINKMDEGSEWDLFSGSSVAVGRLAIQDIQWTNRKDGGLESLTVVYPRLAGLLDVLPMVSEVDFDGGLMLARQLKPKGLNHAVQAALCRQTIERIQRNKRPATRGSSGR